MSQGNPGGWDKKTLSPGCSLSMENIVSVLLKAKVPPFSYALTIREGSYQIDISQYFLI